MWILRSPGWSGRNWLSFGGSSLASLGAPIRITALGCVSAPDGGLASTHVAAALEQYHPPHETKAAAKSCSCTTNLNSQTCRKHPSRAGRGFAGGGHCTLYLAQGSVLSASSTTGQLRLLQGYPGGTCKALVGLGRPFPRTRPSVPSWLPSRSISPATTPSPTVSLLVLRHSSRMTSPHHHTQLD